MENTNTPKTGAIILGQLKALDRNALISWGSKHFMYVKNGLAFQINTPRINNGWVSIVLNEAQDLYEISFYNSRKKLLNEVKEVFVDELVYTIDNNIENEEYVKRVYT